MELVVLDLNSLHIVHTHSDLSWPLWYFIALSYLPKVFLDEAWE